MAIEMKVYEGSANLTELGTIEDQIGKEGTVSLLKKNFQSGKRVAVLCKNAKGESAIISCSETLSKQLRIAKEAGATKEELLASLLELQILENEDGIAFITMPSTGERIEGTKVSALKKVKVSDKVKITSLEEVPW